MENLAHLTLAVDVTLSPRQLAEAFCELSDEGQSQVFIEAAAIAAGWDGGGPGWQWVSVGRHLRTCSCSTEAARDMVQTIARGTQEATVRPAPRRADGFPIG